MATSPSPLCRRFTAKMIGRHNNFVVSAAPSLYREYSRVQLAHLM
jgi:hypothetical protein